MAYTASDRDSPAHQARQQQVAGGAQPIVLGLEDEALREACRDDMLELIAEQTCWHNNWYAVEVRLCEPWLRNACYVCVFRNQ